MGKAVSNLFGLSRGDAGQLGAASDASMGAFNDASKDYQAQAQNRTAFGNQLANQAMGTAPSIANAQMNMGLDRTLHDQLAAAKAARSVNPALAFRQTQRAGEEAMQQTAQAAAIARLQEQQANQTQFQNYLTGLQNQRAQFLGLNTQAAGGIANANAQQAASENAFTGGLISAAAGGAAAYAGMKKAHGGIIEAPEVVPGDSTKNDIVDAKLSGGEMVIPKSVVEQGHSAVSEFAKHLLKQKQPSSKKEKSSGYAAVLAAKNKYENSKLQTDTKFGKK